jgi:hypothetical protein
MTRAALGLAFIAMVGCNEAGHNGTRAPQGSSSELSPTGSETALAEERALVEQAIRSQNRGGFSITKWHAAEPYYAALIGPVNQAVYRQAAGVFSREEALESLRKSEEAIKELLSADDPVPPPGEIKEMRRIGSRLVVEYTAGSGAKRSTYEETYLVAHDAMILNGELKLGKKAAKRQRSAVQGP